MKLQIKDIIDKYKGQKCIVVGHGPSLNEYITKLKTFKDNGYIIIGCNNWNEFYPDCVPHYWVNANTVDNCQNLMNIINTYKPIWVYADSVDLSDQEWLEKNITVDYLAYDQRHFEGKECYCCKTFGCEKYRDSNRLTIQEELQRYTGYNQHYQSGHTVVLHSVAFAILMGFAEIYLTGLDFDYRLGYASNNTNRTPPGPNNYFDTNIYGGDILKDLQIIGESAKMKNIQVYNSNKQTTWHTFDYREIT